MFKKLFSSSILPVLAASSLLTAEIKYDIHDIGTLQTHSSDAIAINNQGQILGWYNIDGSATGKHFFVREKDGSFHELPEKDASSFAINWRYLTDGGKAYGIFLANQTTPTLCVWDKKNGYVKLGSLPGKDIMAINNSGQVLIKSVTEYENGRHMTRPVIWENGKVTKLKGLEGDLGIESEESFGLSMNNKGEVAGQSLVQLSYKDKIYKQIHSVKWIDGKAVDLHHKIPKSTESYAAAINDLGEVLIHSEHGKHLIRQDGGLTLFEYSMNKLNDVGYVYNHNYDYGYPGVQWRSLIYDRNKQLIYSETSVNEKIKGDTDSIWNEIGHVVRVNDKGEIIATGMTIYGEKHAMLLTPVCDAQK